MSDTHEVELRQAREQNRKLADSVDQHKRVVEDAAVRCPCDLVAVPPSETLSWNKTMTKGSKSCRFPTSFNSRLIVRHRGTCFMAAIIVLAGWRRRMMVRLKLAEPTRTRLALEWRDFGESGLSSAESV
eukprot:2513399-Amphidinium_carterae.1